MKRISLLLLISFFFLIDGRTQILDVPYRSDFSGGDWCWAKTAHMIIVYFGNDVLMCELIDLRRQLHPEDYATTDCCLNYFACQGGGGVCGPDVGSTKGLLNVYGISSYCNYDSVPSTTKIQTAMEDNRPMIAYESGHVKLIYGYLYGDLYMHNTGNGAT